GDSAFMDCRNLVRATLPKSLQSIGSAAFMNCSKLASVSVPKGVEIVGGFAFAGCDALETIAVPSTVTGLGVYAFANSRSLTTVRFGKGVTQILTGTFFGCEKLTSVGLPSALESIGEAAFSKCESLLAVALPETLLEIGERAFAECGSLVKVVIPEKTASIGDFAFSECTGLSEVTVSGEETAIGTLAFDGTPWQRGLGAFAVLNGTLMKYQGTAKNASIPQGVTRVGGCAFKDCKKLVSVAVRKGVTAIGEEAFANCGKLTEAAIARTVTQIAANAFANCDKVVIRGYANTEAEAFAAKQGLPFESAGILPISITEASLSAPEQVYTGEPLVPKVTATLDGKRLTEGTDYTVAYSYNIHAGNGIFVATGIGRYDGKKTGTFIIRKAAQSLSVAQPQSMLAGKTQKLKVSEAKTAVYFASSNTKIAKVSEDGVVTGTGYGTAKITVTAKGSDYKTVKKTVSVKVTCPAPKISKIGNVKSGLRILWNASAGAAAYRVFCKDKNGEWQKVGDTTDTAFTAKTDGSTALKVGKKYTFAVRCIKKKGSSVYTSAMREVGKSYVYVPATELEKPVSVKANTAALSWTKTAGVTGYQVQYSKDQTFTKGVRSGKVGNAGKTSAEVDSLGRGKTYYFRIRTYITVRGKNYSSAWSKVKSVVVSG
ncbi:MAG: leucine-rich repeat protein, partial [Lachnospiraceae bacterium]